jgi:hypothetical protein
MAYEKIDDNNFKKIEPATTVFNLVELRNRKTGLQNDIARMQQEITEINDILLEAEKIGVRG